MSYDPSKDRANETRDVGTSGLQAAVTPSNDADLAQYPRGLSVNVSGIVSYIPCEQQGTPTPVAVYMTAGVIYPARPRRVRSTDTTATGIVAWY